jgi:hypothetical protein
MKTTPVTMFNCFSRYGQIKKLVGKLPPEQVTFLKTKMLRSSRTLENSLPRLKQVSSFDEVLDTTRKVLNTWRIIFLLLGILMTIVIVFVLQMVWLSPVIGVAIIPLVVLWVMINALKAYDLPATFNDFCMPLFAILEEEMDKSNTLYLQLDLRGSERKEKLVNREKFGGGLAKTTQFIYHDPLFKCTAELVDKGRLHCEVTSIQRVRKITKRSASGKYKMKTKRKTQAVVSVKLALPMRAAVKEGVKGKVKTGEKRNVIAFRKKIRNIDNETDLLNGVVAVIGDAYMCFYGRASA